MCRCCFPIDYNRLLESVNGRTAPLPIVGQLNDKEYIHWLKATQALTLTVTVLRNFCDTEMQTLHGQLVSQCGSTQCSDSCSAQHVTKQLTIPTCHTGVCSTWLSAIKQERTQSNTRLIVQNSDINQWPIEYWQVAKLFMNQGQDPASALPSDTDASGILNLIQNCKHFANTIDSTKTDAVSITYITAYSHASNHSHTNNAVFDSIIAQSRIVVYLVFVFIICCLEKFRVLPLQLRHFTASF